MALVKIITDSCSDMTKELRDRYDIDYAQMRTVYQGKETPASLDFEYYSPKQLYDIMRNGERVTTTQVPQEEFDRVFKMYLEQGMDIVYVGCSLKLSSSVNTGTMVARRLMDAYPGREIYCVDSMNACMGEGLIAMRAAEYRDQGLSAHDIVEKLLPERNFCNQFCTVQTLDFLKKAGRVTASSAFFGNLLGVKPIIISDKNGNNTAIKKVKGRMSSMKEIVNMMKEAITDPENATIYLGHADCIEDAEELKAMVKEAIPCKDVYTFIIGPIIGASCGPDTIVLYAWGKEVTFAG